MSRLWLLSLLSLLLDGGKAAMAFPDVTPRFCAVVADWQSGKIPPRKLCSKYGAAGCEEIRDMGQAICAASGGLFCTGVANVGQGICRAGSGTFCHAIKTVSGGICAALGESFCTSRNDDQREHWERRLAESCQP